ncbi:hypothetical protein BO70DRAFT_378883 [Aspergillus heteromorphus CBS 117.55]|uniref:Uncharacterized protein n=1 Tax=Aspergillus heteromorphus CBS 117.55 TaxID=1448321 RepID=A0A317WMI9_9EURO|nr:uncharacterized protein BO70DRAFT_378883 [Aspergillus heteromorphus CBS 117.55]PWY86267.1 hypothetical protein BO70DRAFT_378883 [Aspergillus heteromorphus CBS 117.55]
MPSNLNPSCFIFNPWILAAMGTFSPSKKESKKENERKKKKKKKKNERDDGLCINLCTVYMRAKNQASHLPTDLRTASDLFLGLLQHSPSAVQPGPVQSICRPVQTTNRPSGQWVKWKRAGDRDGRGGERKGVVGVNKWVLCTKPVSSRVNDIVGVGDGVVVIGMQGPKEGLDSQMQMPTDQPTQQHSSANMPFHPSRSLHSYW